MPVDPFHIENMETTLGRRAVVAAVRPFLSWVLGLRTYRVLYARAQAYGTASFADRALRALGIGVRMSADAGAVPQQGPLVVAANHPHGMLDGLLLASVLGSHRSDIRILTNHLLARIPELAEMCFFVDPFDGPAAHARSQAGLRAAHLWLKHGRTLVIFPAGEVAHESDLAGGHVDSPWRTTVGRLALASGARVAPVFIDGTNSRLFYAAGRVHPFLRTALLARELLGKRGTTVTVRFGQPLERADFGLDADASRATDTIRHAADALRHAPPRDACPSEASAPSDASSFVHGTPEASSMAAEITRLGSESCVAESGAFRVFLAAARQIPETLQEIGRLREATYRAIGEGTGHRVDLDRFDDYYLHLFCWDRDRKQVVGAYRLGRTDCIAATEGVEGLYTRTLFRYDERLLARLSPALELGRSFIRAEYQKNHNALLLLWKGIGRFVCRHPEYRVLFGPVSISARYSDHSHRLLMAFLEQNCLDHDLAGLVEAIHPAAAAPPVSAPASIEETNRLVAAAEHDGKGVPILLRQYLKLNARLAGFNVDPDFGDVLDALMLVDLTTVDTAFLNRYLGRHEAARFLAHHRTRSAHAA